MTYDRLRATLKKKAAAGRGQRSADRSAGVDARLYDRH
jgi:hypothetical protein